MIILAYDGDSSDLTASISLYPSYSGYQIVYGHTDYYSDWDYGNLVITTSGYYNVNSTTGVNPYVYDSTTGSYVFSSSDSSISNLYLSSGHIYLLQVVGYTTGLSYSLTVQSNNSASGYTDGDSTDWTASKAISANVSGSQSATGHTDYSSDWDYGSLVVGTSGYFSTSCTGNTSAYVYDWTAGAWVSNAATGSTTTDLYLYSNHTYYAYVYGTTSGQPYTLSVTPSSSASSAYDGDATDLTASKVIYPSMSGSQSATGHADSSDDVDYGSLSLSSTGYYNITSTGNTVSCVYDATAGSYVVSSSGGYQSGLYLNASHTNYVCVYGYTAGQTYTVSAAPDTSSHSSDGDSTDWTTNKTVYSNISGSQTASGHTDSSSDWDYGSLVVQTSGYFNINSTGDTTAYVYDVTTGKFIINSSFGGGYNDLVFNKGSYTNELYLPNSDSYYLYVYGRSSGQSYNVSVTPVAKPSSENTDKLNILYSSYYNSSSNGYTDYFGDVDAGIMVATATGYVNISATGNTSVKIYDYTMGNYVTSSSGSYSSNLLLYATRNYGVEVTGYTPDEFWTVTATAAGTDGDGTDMTLSDTIYANTVGSQTVCGHLDFLAGGGCTSTVDECNLVATADGYYNVTVEARATVCDYRLEIYDVTTEKYLDARNFGLGTNRVYLSANDQYKVGIYSYSCYGGLYSITVKPYVSSDPYDEDSNDLTRNKTIYANTSGQQTVYGHTDYLEDQDWCNLTVTKNGYYDLSAAGNVSAVIYDTNSGYNVSSSSGTLSFGGYQSNIYLTSADQYLMRVDGYTPGETYSVTVTPHAS